MPLKLTVGVSRKLGQPGYGSIGSACGVELELESGLLAEAPEESGRRARAAYAACARAVDAELARRAAPPAPTAGRHERRGSPEPDDRRGPPPRPATPRQLRALGDLARARGIGPDELLAGDGLDAGTLSAAEASRLISGLRSAAG